jgi:hypothetical protein
MIFTQNTPIIDQVMVSKDRADILELKKKIVNAVLKSKDGVCLAKLGECSPDGKNVQCRLSQECLNKLRNELGLLGIASSIIKGEIADPKTHKCPVYLFATNAPAG